MVAVYYTPNCPLLGWKLGKLTINLSKSRLLLSSIITKLGEDDDIKEKAPGLYVNHKSTNPITSLRQDLKEEADAEEAKGSQHSTMWHLKVVLKGRKFFTFNLLELDGLVPLFNQTM